MNMEATSREGRHEVLVSNPKLARGENQARSKRVNRSEERDPLPWALTVRELRDTKREIQRLSNELLAVQENERKRIAADLHDGLGQSLSVFKLLVKTTIAHLESSSTDEASKSLAVLDAKVQETLTEVRRVCLDLRPSMIDDLGILPTLSWLLREMEEAGRLEVSKVVTVEEADVPEKLKITLFRVVQEAMCNIAKHAEASRVRVIFLRTEDSLRLIVEDNGRGFDPAVVAQRAGAGRGLGVRGMMERVRLSGGEYRLESAPGKGARIQMSWPIEVRADGEAADHSRAA